MQFLCWIDYKFRTILAPLKLKFIPSPYLVVKRSNEHIKKYDGADPIFAILPAEINRMLLNNFNNFQQNNGIQLYDPEDKTVQYINDQEESKSNQDEIIDQINKIECIPDKFHPEEPCDNDSTQILLTKSDLPARSLIEDDLRTLHQTRKDRPDEEDHLDPEEDPVTRVEEEPVSSDDESIDETAGRKLRERRPKTVRFEPEV